MRILFRVDGSTRIGTGHIMRCLTLAEEFKKQGGEAVFVTKDYDRAIIQRIRSAGYSVMAIPAGCNLKMDLELTLKLIKEQAPKIVITDSYDLTSGYLSGLKSGFKDGLLVSIDDIFKNHFYADIVLNQNITATREKYKGKIEPYTKLLLGTRYALLRKEFRQRVTKERKFNKVHNVLVTLGGADPDNQVLKTVKALGVSEINFKITVVVGISYRYLKALKRFVAKAKKSIRIVRNINNMAKLMSQADIAISAGGTTCWELACAGLPNIIIVIADNQKEIADKLDKAGVSVNLGWFKKITGNKIVKVMEALINDSSRRREMSRKGKKLVDGLGAKRASKLILNRIRFIKSA
ncbi:MAG: UDP-2,4-diacetamido-2,4,6-trideoxy-beta-L-altropyranose hydrolase [Planctomycetes bacterium]|nr:UDP-2,4-diacetamido-2,4,6-trideoxy-beta-L-altropyranose hydrolase [Planctomycetota bacterium]